MVIYRGISTLETTGIFITLAVNYYGIWTLEKVGVFTTVIYHGKLPQYFYNIGPLVQVGGSDKRTSLMLTVHNF